jgi:hypothetical protein
VSPAASAPVPAARQVRVTAGILVPVPVQAFYDSEVPGPRGIPKTCGGDESAWPAQMRDS